MGPGGIPAQGQFSNPLFAQGQQARQQQQDYIGQIQNAINGNAPSLAQVQLQQGVAANIAGANALAASAGPGNAAMASRQAMQNAGMQNQALAGQSAALRAQEYNSAMQQMGTATTNQRAADLQGLGMSYQNAIAQAQLEQGQNNTQAQMEMGQRGMNDAAALGYRGMGNDALNNDLASRMHYMDLMAGKYSNDRNLAAQQSQFNITRSDQQQAAAMNMGSTMLSAGLSRGWGNGGGGGNGGGNG
jgi:hypothetical protein